MMFSKFKNILVLGLITVQAASTHTDFPQVTLNGDEVITGVTEENIEAFKGIPFAAPPINDLRFRRAQPFEDSYDGLDATTMRKACPQINPKQLFSTAYNLLELVPDPLRGPIHEIASTTVSMDEDCLYLNIYRPKGIKAGDKVPVMVWVYGGAFILGSTGTYPGTQWINESDRMGLPIIYVSVSYRLGPYGFLGGEDITNEGNSNAGLTDLHESLKWIHNHIADFGGDPDHVTIFGESAGAMLISHYMIFNGGDNTYEGKPLYHAAILESGGILPFANSSSANPTKEYDIMVELTNCSDAEDKLECMRGRSFEEIEEAKNSYTLKEVYGGIDQFLGYSPRQDGDLIDGDPLDLWRAGKFPDIPIIMSNQEDEGTILAPLFYNSSTPELFKAKLQGIFHYADESEIDQILEYYPNDPLQGAPFRTGPYNRLTPQWKRFGAFATDAIFHSGRRVMLEHITNKKWYLFSTTLHGLPFIGTFHANCLIWQFFLDSGPSRVYRQQYISFATFFDPNAGNDYPDWPEWTSENRETLLVTGETPEILEEGDTYREESIYYLGNTPNIRG